LLLYSCRTEINDLPLAVPSLLSGVIQGRVIRPLMFLVYINDFVTLFAHYGIKIKLLFADDVKLYVKVVDYSDVAKLQQALIAWYTWAAVWQLGISVDNVLLIGKVGSIGQFCINGIPLPVVTECRDLGVTITHDLSHSSHISDIIFKAHQRSNLVHRCCVSRNPNLLVRAFVTYVPPLLEYNALFGLLIQKTGYHTC